MSENTTTITRDANVIKHWAQERGGKPAVVGDSDKGPGEGVIKIKFNEDKDLKPVEWDQFFRAFKKNDLAMIYQEKTEDGDKSKFHKFVNKDTQEAKEMWD